MKRTIIAGVAASILGYLVIEYALKPALQKKG